MQNVFDKIISYHDLINGALVPDKLSPTAIANYLKSEQLPCKDMIVGRFKGSILVEKLRITSTNPLAEKYFPKSSNITQSLYFQLKYNSLSRQIEQVPFDQLKLDFQLYSIHPVSMPSNSEWTKIDEHRLRYCYINQLLSNMEVEHITEIRRISLVNDDEQSKAKISKLHRLLHSFLLELTSMFQLTPSELELQIKKEYTTRDCAILVYRSIVKIIDFTYESFKRYMDFSLNVPCSSTLLNNNNFLLKTKKLENRLNRIDLDEELRNILNDEIDRIIKFQTLKKITFKEYDYYTVLFKSMTRFFLNSKNSVLDPDRIIDFLIFTNFKNEAFFEYLIESMISTSNDYDDAIDKHDYLILKKKEYVQLEIKASLYNKVDESHLIKILQKWIDIELSHINIVANTSEDKKVEVKPELKKIRSNVPINILVIFYRLFLECEVVSVEKKIEFAKWIVKTHTNQTNREFSLNSINNKMVNPTSSYIKRAQEILLEMYEKSKLL